MSKLKFRESKWLAQGHTAGIKQKRASMLVLLLYCHWNITMWRVTERAVVVKQKIQRNSDVRQTLWIRDKCWRSRQWKEGWRWSPRAAFQEKEVLLAGWAEVVLTWRLELRSWAGGPNAKPVLAFLSQEVVDMCSADKTNTPRWVAGEGVCFVCRAWHHQCVSSCTETHQTGWVGSDLVRERRGAGMQLPKGCRCFAAGSLFEIEEELPQCLSAFELRKTNSAID